MQELHTSKHNLWMFLFCSHFPSINIHGNMTACVHDEEQYTIIKERI